jgi:hypothetical protein
MSNNSKIKEVEILKKETVIDIKLPVDFYFRFNQFILEFFPIKDGKELENIIKNIKEGKENEHVPSYHFRTLLSFLLLVEDEARKQGHTKMVKLNTEDGTLVNED